MKVKKGMANNVSFDKTPHKRSGMVPRRFQSR